jgi:hypothetical protein
MKILVVKNTKAKLQEAYKLLERRIGIRYRSIYPFNGRYRMMIAGLVTPQELSAILNDPSFKISEK